MDIVSATIEEWRELGFHYSLEEELGAWIITGSEVGLLKFANILRLFASDPRNDAQFAHEHYGPYWYLKIQNIPDERGFSSNAIFAPRRDFSELASLIEARLANSKIGDTLDLTAEFAANSEYALRLIVAPVNFDPGLFDPWVQLKMSELG